MDAKYKGFTVIDILLKSTVSIIWFKRILFMTEHYKGLGRAKKL